MSGRESSAVQLGVAAVQAGSSLLAASREFECSPQSIRRAMRRRGLPPGKQSLSEKSLTAADMTNSGRNAQEVARDLGLTTSKVRQAEHRVRQLRNKTPVAQSSVTPLLAFMRALNEELERLEEFVASLELINGKPTTGGYLYQLAGNPAPNPTLRAR